MLIRMRCKISLMVEGGGTLPFNYNHFLAGVLYRAFRTANLELAKSLHESRDIKLYTFSEIKGGKPSSQGLHFNNKAWFYLSSPRSELMRAAVEGLLASGSVTLGPLSFHLDSMEILKPPVFNGSPMVFRTLSPICVTTMREVDGKLKQWDLYPNEQKFYHNLVENLVKKYIMLHAIPPKNKTLEIKVLSSHPVRIRIKDTYHRASHMVFLAHGSKELIEIGYECGFGEKNSMGFGMVEVIVDECKK
jgi:CRISPR-associated endoribonuclease Cas6